MRHAALLRLALHEHARGHPSFGNVSRMLRHLTALAVLAAHADIVLNCWLLLGILAPFFLPRMVGDRNAKGP